MNFGEALQALKEGKKVRRNGWASFALYIYLVPGSKFEVNRPPLNGFFPEGTEVAYSPHIDMVRSEKPVVAEVWSPYQAEILAEDWEVVE